MDTLLEIFFLPPMALARLGSSPTPVESFEWSEDKEIHGGNRTVIKPAVTLEVQEDGSLRPYLPDEIHFKDEQGRIRPVAPFFELWATLQAAEDGSLREQPLTLGLLRDLGASLDHLQYRIEASNNKAATRTGEATCSFTASVTLAGNDHDKQALWAFSRYTSGQEPLVFPEKPILLGHVQVIQPVERVVGAEAGLPQAVDLSILRLRYTPPPGQVFGPPDAIAGPATRGLQGFIFEPRPPLYGRIHEIVPAENRILNDKTSWSSYIAMTGLHDDPTPQDSYDGARVGDNVAWGVVDDTCDATIEATLAVGGQRFYALARVFTGPPDYAPDCRHFYNIADDLADRDLPPAEVSRATLTETTAEIVDLFHRAFETMSQVNLDAVRSLALQDNADLMADYTGHLPDQPKTGPESMTEFDKPYVDKIPSLVLPQPAALYSNTVRHDRLPYTHAAPFIHAQMIDETTLLDFFRRRKDYLKLLIRPPFGTLAELAENSSAKPDSAFRDPRVFRDRLHDMRMPPFIRDSNYFPLSLTRRQYTLLRQFIELLAEEETR